MDFILTDWLRVTGAAGSLLSGLGLIGTMATVLFLARQTRAMQQASVTAAYQGIIGMGNSFYSVLLEHPEIFHAMHDGAQTIERWDWDEQMRLRPQVAVFTVQQLDYFELVLVSSASFPRALQEEWRDYIRGLLGRNPYMQRALLDTDWYTPELRALAL